jgi:uncharacterized protein YpuA (DUF1002 family)
MDETLYTICTDFQEAKDTPEQIRKEVVDMGRQFNLEMDKTVVDELIASHTKESLFNDIIELHLSYSLVQDAKSDK